jgi:hypothetical protein
MTRQKQRSVNSEAVDKNTSPTKTEKLNSYNSTNTSLESSLINENYIAGS